MDNSKIIFLINDQVRAVRAVYEEETNKNQPVHTFKTLDEDVKVGDLVIVPSSTRHMFTVVKVIEVDVDVNFDASGAIEWIVSRIDQSNFALHKEQEAKAISVVQQAQLRRKKAELREAMFKDHEDKIATLQIATKAMPAE